MITPQQYFMVIRILSRFKFVTISTLCSLHVYSRKQCLTSCGFSRVTQHVLPIWRNVAQRVNPVITGKSSPLMFVR